MIALSILAAFGASPYIELLAMGLLLLGSAFFSGSETALFTLTTQQRESFSQGRHVSQRMVAGLLKRPNRLLNTLLMGNMIVNIAFSATAAVLVVILEEAGHGTLVIGAASLAPLLAVILLGEVMPKMLAWSVAPRWSRLVAGPLVAIQRILLGPVWLLERTLVAPITRIIAPHPPPPRNITAEELGALMELSTHRGVIDRDAAEILQEIVELTDLRACDIMVPRVDMIAFDINRPGEELAELLRETRLRRVPIYDDNLDNILGLVHAKRILLNPDRPIRELIRPVAFLPEAADLEKLLLQFRRGAKQMAIVVDEYGGTAGLVTLEDVIEEIVGDIPDISEAGAPPEVEKRSDTEYIVGGDLAIHDWADAFDMDIDRKRISTLGGLVTTLLGRIPHTDDQVQYRNLRFTVRAMRGRRVETLRLEVLGGETP
jgi:putative hemolysin